MQLTKGNSNVDNFAEKISAYAGGNLLAVSVSNAHPLEGEICVEIADDKGVALTALSLLFLSMLKKGFPKWKIAKVLDVTEENQDLEPKSESNENGRAIQN